MTTVKFYTPDRNWAMEVFINSNNNIVFDITDAEEPENNFTLPSLAITVEDAKIMVKVISDLINSSDK